MLSKTRTTIITLIAAFSFAAVAAPVASALPAEGSSYDCALGKKTYEERISDYNKLKDNPETSKPAADRKKEAEHEKKAAEEAGCDTKGWPACPLTAISGLIPTPVGALQGSLLGGTPRPIQVYRPTASQLHL